MGRDLTEGNWCGSQNWFSESFHAYTEAVHLLSDTLLIPPDPAQAALLQQVF